MQPQGLAERRLEHGRRCGRHALAHAGVHADEWTTLDRNVPTLSSRVHREEVFDGEVGGGDRVVDDGARSRSCASRFAARRRSAHESVADCGRAPRRESDGLVHERRGGSLEGMERGADARKSARSSARSSPRRRRRMILPRLRMNTPAPISCPWTFPRLGRASRRIGPRRRVRASSRERLEGRAGKSGSDGERGEPPGGANALRLEPTHRGDASSQSLTIHTLLARAGHDASARSPPRGTRPPTVPRRHRRQYPRRYRRRYPTQRRARRRARRRRRR